MTFAPTFPWHQALAFALTGQRTELADTVRPAVGTALEDLAAAGWDRDCIAAEAERAHAAGEPWPHPVPEDLREDLGAAAFHAMVADAKARLGIDQPASLPLAHRPLDADERRLSADLPPHHGHVG